MMYSVKDVRCAKEAKRLADAHEVFFNESLYRDLDFCRETTEQAFLAMMLDSDFHVLVVYDEDQNIAGYSAFAFERNCSKQEVALGVWFYILPEHRRGGCSQMLVDKETELCQNRGARKMFTSSTAGFADNGCNERAYTKLRQRNGYAVLGTFLVREFG